MAAASFLELGAGDMLAYHRSTGPPGCPEVVFCHGESLLVQGHSRPWSMLIIGNAPLLCRSQQHYVRVRDLLL